MTTTTAAGTAERPLPINERQEFCLLRVLRIIRAMPLRFAVISLALLIPCFWQPQIEAEDLSSHIYNAWLVQLIQQGKAPGLWIARQSTNVLFDWTLKWLMGKVGVGGAQRMAVSVAVLIFFWGAFGLVAAIVRNMPWSITPLLAILTYGTIFDKGLFNYYVAGGLSLAALAVLWEAIAWDGIVAVPLLALAWLAQPLPVLWAIAVFGYVCLLRHVAVRFRLALFVACVGAFLGVREFIVTHWRSIWEWRQIMYATGANQSFVLGPHFRLITLAVVVVWAAAFLQLARNLGLARMIASIPVQVYFLCFIGCSLLPHTIWFPEFKAFDLSGLPRTIVFGGIDTRIGWLAAVFMCALVAQVRSTVWYGRVLIVLGLVYFSFLYADNRAMNKIEQRARELVSTLPADQRVIGPEFIDRACIGKCFSFGNYEAATGEFRVRATAGNSIVTWSVDPERPVYNWAKQFFDSQPDAGLYHIYRCSDKASDVCMRHINRRDLASLMAYPIW